MKLLFRCSILLPLMYVSSVFAGACGSAIDCDCKNIPNESLKMSCITHERMLKESCASEKQGVQAFCAQHGPAGFPVATTIKLEPQSPSSSVDDSNRLTAQLYWSVRQDAYVSEEGYQQGDIDRAAVILRISKRNLDSLFKTQRSVDQAISASGEQGDNIWISYSADTFSLAEHWHKYLAKVQPNTEQRALYEPLAELVGYMYEMAGYSYAKAEQFAAASQSWKLASTISADMLALAVSASDDGQNIDKYKSLTASRLHRASLYWVQSSGDDDPKLLARKADELASDKLLQEILSGGSAEES